MSAPVPLTPQREPAGSLSVAGSVDRGSFRLDVRLDVGPGEVLGVLGPNGAGKSTLLRALAGLEMLSSGSISLGGVLLDDVRTGAFVPPEQRPVGLVFQDYRLFPHLDVRDNIAFAARARGAGRRPSRTAADRWLDELDLADLAGRRPHQLSGGQAQRVALARALAAEPELLLLDEPLAALDAKTRLDVRAQLRNHIDQFTGPVLVITHDPLEAMVMADRLLVIENGRVVQSGSPLDVARRPATQYVARLAGLNLYAGTLDSDSRVVELDGGGALAVNVGDEVDPVAPLARVLVVLRPSAVTLHADRPMQSSARNIWSGTVAGLEMLADRVRVQVDSTPPVLVDVSAAAVFDLSLRPGSPVWLAAKATETQAYPEPSGGLAAR